MKMSQTFPRINTPTVKWCGDDIDRWRARYIALRDRWRQLEQRMKAEDDPKRRRKLELQQIDVGAERNKTMGRIAELVNKVQ
jgi:hypothetical protein